MTITSQTIHLQSSAGASVYHITSPPARLVDGNRQPRAQSRARPRHHHHRLTQPDTGVQLLHDLAFPGACHKLRATPSGTHLVGVGVYPPQLRVYEFAELGLKFQRNMQAAACDVTVLEDDWRKLAVLRVDRTVEIHAQQGMHCSIRVPSHGRAMVLHPSTCDLFIAASKQRVYRLNLDEGRFLPPLETESESNEAIALNVDCNLVGVGGNAGVAQTYDPRTEPNRCVQMWDVAQDDRHGHGGVTAMDFDGLYFLVGTDTGTALLYDIRSRQPIGQRRVGYGLPLRTVAFHNCEKSDNRRLHAVVADRKCVKIFEPESIENTPMASFEPPADIHHVEVRFGGSGLMMVGCEDRPVHTYYVPALGPAPRWCSFLENLTEEMAECTGWNTTSRSESVPLYEHFKFVTRAELEALGLSRLLGTESVHPYLHGFLVDIKMYRNAKAAADPLDYEEWRKKRIEEKIHAQREQRIRKPAQRGDRHRASKQDDRDDRFVARWKDSDYAIDEQHDRWRHLHPTESTKLTRQGDSDSEQDESDESVASCSSSDADEDQLARTARDIILERERKAQKYTSRRVSKASVADGIAKQSEIQEKESTIEERMLPLRERLRRKKM